MKCELGITIKGIAKIATVTTFEDYRDLGGGKFPFTITTSTTSTPNGGHA